MTTTRATIRYETIIATLVGVSALFVSGYTAYVQHQQVRAAVWPILEFGTSNDPYIYFSLDNKGVGPAIIHHVKVTVDGRPVSNWPGVLRAVLGPGEHKFLESDMTGHTLAGGESMKVLIPHEDANEPVTLEKGGPFWEKLNPGRRRVGIEICYSSTLGDCWILKDSGTSPSTTSEIGRCPDRTASDTFRQ